MCLSKSSARTTVRPNLYCGACEGSCFWLGGGRKTRARERSLEKALAVARHQGVRLQDLSAARSLAQLWQRQARREAALALLGPIYAWFTEGFEYPDLRNARALLEELSKA
jgi:predicted ATPase